MEFSKSAQLRMRETQFLSDAVDIGWYVYDQAMWSLALSLPLAEPQQPPIRN